MNLEPFFSANFLCLKIGTTVTTTFSVMDFITPFHILSLYHFLPSLLTGFNSVELISVDPMGFSLVFIDLSPFCEH